mmetsp:Transcript_46776/g.69190  ORF Transcript_46776/g.69190 Transcript_46776/m.69190 type:complete len:89 (-) Transcript_46776:1476-1742(-)
MWQGLLERKKRLLKQNQIRNGEVSIGARVFNPNISQHTKSGGNRDQDQDENKNQDGTVRLKQRYCSSNSLSLDFDFFTHETLSQIGEL